MTAPSTLPAEVRKIVAALNAGDETLIGMPNAWINAAFEAGVIEASPQVGQGYTRYRLRPRAVAS